MPSEVPTVSGDESAEELRRQLAEAREQQAATAEILRIISSSPTDLQRVFAEIATSAARLCDAYDAVIRQVDSEVLRLVAHHGPIPTGPVVPLRRSTLPGRAALERRTIHIADLQAETEEYPEGSDRARSLGFRTMLGVPLIRAGEAIGTISIRRNEVRPFTDRQIELLKTFADQAVITIENARLFEEVQTRNRELRATLEQQTATSDILGVISRSPTGVQPVFDAIAESAAKLCDAELSVVARFDGENIHLAALVLQSEQQRAAIEKLYPRKPDRATQVARAILTRRTQHVPDTTRDPAYADAPNTGFQSALAVPMLREGLPIGAVSVGRTRIGGFSDGQVELLKTFADQAVIAIENARLFEAVQARTRELAKTVEDLEIASQHKSQFVANMSHELRTPLAAILGYAELMQEGFYGDQSKKSLDALTRIRSNGKHLLGLINTVLDIAKIESGQFTLNMSEYAIESVVETVRAATESLAETKKLALKTEVAKSLPFGVGDEQRLTQVLLNLVGNAIKFTDAGEVRIVASAANSHFNVTVTDTGPGIPEEHQARIFEQFHQVDSSNTKAKGGTGLGLAISKQIVEMHGGRIWVESFLGKGSAFHMELPVRAAIKGAT